MLLYRVGHFCIIIMGGGIFMANKNNNVLKFTKKPEINIGLIIFFVIFIYIVISVFIFAFSKKTNIYEVNAGSLTLDNTYTGFVIRQETLVKSTHSGNINYFLANGNRASIGTVVYSVDETGRVYDKIKQSISSELDSKEISSVKNMLTDFTKNYSTSEFYNIYDYREDVSSKIYEFQNNDIAEQLDTFIEETDSTNLFHIIDADKTGVVSYVIDGYETSTENILSDKLFDTSEYKSTNLQNAELINMDDVAYKLVTDDEWCIYIPFNENETVIYANTSTVMLEFVENGLECEGNIEIINIGGASYGKITLNKYMINFIEDRFVQLKISKDNYTGLKIPVTSVFEKSFYTIPKEYLTPSNTFIKKFYDEKGAVQTAAIDAEIYEENDQYYFVSMDSLSSGDILMLPDSDKTYVVGTMEELTGVYCVNKGYAIFRKVNILEQNSEYCIISKGTKYGLSIYDHIVLDHTTAKENEIVH